jgi:hypothetical protein
MFLFLKNKTKREEFLDLCLVDFWIVVVYGIAFKIFKWE